MRSRVTAAVRAGASSSAASWPDPPAAHAGSPQRGRRRRRGGARRGARDDAVVHRLQRRRDIPGQVLAGRRRALAPARVERRAGQHEELRAHRPRSRRGGRQQPTDDVLHWMVWNIPATTTALPEAVPQGAESPDGTRQISVTGPYYRGPAAPATGPVHHYVFELYALECDAGRPGGRCVASIDARRRSRGDGGTRSRKGVMVALHPAAWS